MLKEAHILLYATAQNDISLKEKGVLPLMLSLLLLAAIWNCQGAMLDMPAKATLPRLWRDQTERAPSLGSLCNQRLLTPKLLCDRGINVYLVYSTVILSLFKQLNL